jgi:hypothetical protein
MSRTFSSCHSTLRTSPPEESQKRTLSRGRAMRTSPLQNGRMVAWAGDFVNSRQFRFEPQREVKLWLQATGVRQRREPGRITPPRYPVWIRTWNRPDLGTPLRVFERLWSNQGVGSTKSGSSVRGSDVAFCPLPHTVSPQRLWLGLVRRGWPHQRGLRSFLASRWPAGRGGSAAIIRAAVTPCRLMSRTRSAPGWLGLTAAVATPQWGQCMPRWS